jgi:hypothetical protein
MSHCKLKLHILLGLRGKGRVNQRHVVGNLFFLKLAARCLLLHVPCLNLNSVNQLIFVMVKCGVLFEVRTEFLNNI